MRKELIANFAAALGDFRFARSYETGLVFVMQIPSVLVVLFSVAGLAPVLANAQGSPSWVDVGRILGSAPVATGGYQRFSFPRKDLTVRVKDVTIGAALALGSWAGFDGTVERSEMMGDLVVTAAELPSVARKLVENGLAITAIHNHLLGEDPQIMYVHFHGHGSALDLAKRLDPVLAATGTPRPVQPAASAALTIDTVLVFKRLGKSGRASGSFAGVSLTLIRPVVKMAGMAVRPALGLASPINLQMVDTVRAVATGDFAVLATEAPRLIETLVRGGITPTAVHSHLIGESPKVTYVHFWGDMPVGPLLDALAAAIASTQKQGSH